MDSSSFFPNLMLLILETMNLNGTTDDSHLVLCCLQLSISTGGIATDYQ